MTVGELIEKLKAFPSDALLVRKADEFSTLVNVEPGVSAITVKVLNGAEFGDYVKAEPDGSFDDWHQSEGEPFRAVQIDQYAPAGAIPSA